jgi:hypothetical protein
MTGKKESAVAGGVRGDKGNHQGENEHDREHEGGAINTVNIAKVALSSV